MNKSTLKGISTVIGGFLIHLTLGTFYTMGNMNTYMTSYLKQRVDPKVNHSQFVWVYALAILGQGSFMVVGGLMERKIGPSFTCFIGCFIFSGAVSLTACVIHVGFIPVTLLYGLIAGFGCGIAYIGPIAAGMNWFPENKGCVTGVIVAGYGIGALVFSYVQTVYLNPSNISPDERGIFTQKEILDKVPFIFPLLGAIYGTVQMIGCLMLFRPPKEPAKRLLDLLSEISLEQYSLPSLEKTALSQIVSRLASQDALKAEGMTPSEMIKTKEFCMLYITYALGTQEVLFINTLYKAFGQRFIHDDHFLTTVGSVSSMCNSLARMLWGYLHDKLSYKTCMLLITSLQCFFTLTFATTEYFGKTVFFIWVLAMYLSFAGFSVLMPSAVATIFGKTYAGTNYGILFTSPGISSVVGAALFEVIYACYGWFPGFVLLFAFSLFAFVITYLFPDKAVYNSRKPVSQQDPPSR